MANLSEDELQPVSSWLEATQNSKGYQDKSLVVDLIEKFKVNLPNRLSNNPIICLNQRQIHLLLAFFKVVPNSKFLSIGDFGGGNGYMYDFLRVNNPDVKIIYDVYETTEIAEGYNYFGKSLEINFLDKNKFGKKQYDLVIISCTLQYTKDWKDVLTISSRIANNVLLMRLPLTDADKHNFFIQHNNSKFYRELDTSWPIILFSKKLFLKEIRKNFEIVFELNDSEENYPFKGRNFPMNSLLLKSKEY
jgi:putative methyltransferase (TIGR04325 family)